MWVFAAGAMAAVLAALVLFVGVRATVRRTTAQLERFRTEAAAIGFSPSPAPGPAGRFHMVGAYEGVPAILGFYPGDSNPEGEPKTTGVRVTLALEAAGPGIHTQDGSRFTPQSFEHAVIAASWPEGWSGPLSQTWLPLTADRAEMTRGLQTLWAARR